ncbi:MAG: HlyD family type I secretion periplasmic adaptor subunit [Lentisphaeria bacterium]|nr:HlyD family type I secretion periplasmic adaptor subunit [Lentisphaeria bacterium]
MKHINRAGGQDAVPEQIIESQPDALEIKNQPLPLYIKLGVWFPVVAVAIAIIWACFARTDVIVQGTGKLVTNRPTIVMKPLERSVIKQIHVRIGDMVKTGQILITFDPEINKAEADRLRNEIVALEAQLSRLQAEFQGQAYAGGQEQFSRWQQAIYQQRREYYKERLNYYSEALKQIDASVKSNRDSLRKQKERLESMKTLEEMFRSLHQKKAASLKDLIQISISRMEMESTVDRLSNELLELEHRKGTTIAEKNTFIQEWRNKISEEMVSVDRNLASIRKEYDKQARLLEYVHLRAPCNAIVHEVAPFSPGSAVREAESLITLVPLEGSIELEAELRPEDIGKVRTGAQAKIKLTAWPFQKHGTLDGVVRNISEDTLEKTMGGVQIKYYRVRITISGKLHGVHDNFRLIPGMETQCEIKCGRRRVIEYILYPLIKALDETAREP